MKQFKRCSALLLGALAALSLVACSKKDATGEQERFDQFIQQEFVDTMESDYPSMHIFLIHPEDFGVDPSAVEVGLGLRVDEQTIEKTAQDVAAAREEFQTFDRKLLTEEQQDTYDIYQFQIDLDSKLCDPKFDYYQQAFGSTTGLHTQIPTLLSDWQLRSEQGVKDLIAVVGDVKPYVDSLLDYTRKQEEKGLLMTDLDGVIQYCQGVTAAGENSAVLHSMNANIDALQLDKETAGRYKAELKEAFENSFLPAYEEIITTMEALKSGDNNQEGLAHFEYGKEYYTLLLKQNVGSNKSVEEIRQMMEDACNRYDKGIETIILENPDLYESFVNFPTTGFGSYTAILDDFQGKMYRDYPEVSNLDYNIVNINEEIANSGVAAYFNIPPIDDTGDKQLRVNPDIGGVDDIYTYSVVAHEGYPGHMYQNAYAYENLDSPYRKALANSPAYSEGFAVYAQYSAFQYLDGIDPRVLDAYRQQELYTYCAIVLSDIGIHYDGWSLQEFQDFLTEMGLELGDEALYESQYKQLQSTPCAFQPYYVGYEEFMALRRKAEKELGDSFNQKAFHEAILKSGAAPFCVVERNVDKYINASK